MNIIFFGTPAFSAEIFSFLLKENINIQAVVTQPDKPKGRSQKLQPSELKKRVLELSPEMPIYQPIKASHPDSIEQLRKYKPDLFVVAAFGQILRQPLLDVPLLDCINIHTSLLPKYRGAAPIQRAIMNGDVESGVTIMKMVLGLDAGDILAKSHIPIPPNMTYGELEQELAVSAGPLLLRVLKAYQDDSVKSIPQDESRVTLAPKIQPSECQIDTSKSVQDVHNLIRSLSPTPGAWVWAEIGGEKKKMKIFRSKIHSILPSKNPCLLPCKGGFLELLEIQMEGKKRMNAQDFLRGLREEISFYN